MKRDQKSFDRVFRQYYDPLLFFAMQYIPNQADCHDIVNDVYEELWRNFSKIEESTTKQFLFACVRNRCIDTLRKHNLHSRYIDFVEHMSQKYTYEDHMMENEDNNS